MRRLLVLAAVVFGALAGFPAPARASCTELNSTGDLVFVGTAVATTNAGRFARFAVEEIWSGDQSLAANGEITIVGGPDWPDFSDNDQSGVIAMSGEHFYRIGDRYLVVATKDDQWARFGLAETNYPPGALTDGTCTTSAPWTDDMASQRPTDATLVERTQPIGPEPWNQDSSPPYVIIALTTVLVAGGCLYLLFRRGSIAYRARQDDDSASPVTRTDGEREET